MTEQKKTVKKDEHVQVKNTETITGHHSKNDEGKKEDNSGTDQWSDRKASIGSGPENLGSSGNP